MNKIPDTDLWVPEKGKVKILEEAFQKRCKHIEQLILQKVKQEIEMNIHNFDSGLGIEDIIREEFSTILPKRYHVTKGVVNDRNGYSAGDLDLIVFNEQWFPAIKFGATKESRRFHYPVEGIYAVGEVKQRIDFRSLDEAMKKLVVTARLERPKTTAGRINERTKMNDCIHQFTNPLFKFIVATDIDPELNIDEIFTRYVKVNQTLKRTEVVNALCILGHGTFTWGYFSEEFQEIKSARFCGEDLYSTIVPAANFVRGENDSALYYLLLHLMNSLYFSVLAAEDIAIAYGKNNSSFQSPKNEEFQIRPDTEWLELLDIQCKH